MKQSTTTTGYRNGYCTPELRKAMRDAIANYVEQIHNGTDLCVSVSPGNRKTGWIPSVSLMPYITCPAACKGTCDGKCYAGKLCAIYENVMQSYAKNTAIWQCNPELYFNTVKAVAVINRFFRYHVAGDIPNADYFDRMVTVARECPNCTFLAFTKRYSIVNAWIDNNGPLPSNLKILLSGWSNLKPINPYNLPETTAYGKKEEPNDAWLLCGGNCSECGCRGCGCWKAEKGETIAFQIH